MIRWHVRESPPPPSPRQRRRATCRRCSALVQPPPRVRYAGPPAADGVPLRTRGEKKKYSEPPHNSRRGGTRGGGAHSRGVCTQGPTIGRLR